MASWHTSLEKRLIREYGGIPESQYGVDGEINGRPVEVRAARKDRRFRLGREVHRTLLDADGFYIFHDDDHGSRLMDAIEVDDLLPAGEWYQDRGYPHKFVTVEEVFGSPFGGFGVEDEGFLGDGFDLSLDLDF